MFPYGNILQFYLSIKLRYELSIDIADKSNNEYNVKIHIV